MENKTHLRACGDFEDSDIDSSARRREELEGENWSFFFFLSEFDSQQPMTMRATKFRLFCLFCAASLGVMARASAPSCPMMTLLVINPPPKKNKPYSDSNMIHY